jgi:hypothetical protein
MEAQGMGEVGSVHRPTPKAGWAGLGVVGAVVLTVLVVLVVVRLLF